MHNVKWYRDVLENVSIFSSWDSKYLSASDNSRITFSDNIATISTPGDYILKVSYVNLLNYPNYCVTFKLYNPSNNRISVGVRDDDNYYCFIQDVATTNMTAKFNGEFTFRRSLSTNLFAKTNTWHNITIEKRRGRILMTIDANSYLIPNQSFGKHVFFRKWFRDSLKIKDE